MLPGKERARGERLEVFSPTVILRLILLHQNRFSDSRFLTHPSGGGFKPAVSSAVLTAYCKARFTSLDRAFYGEDGVGSASEITLKLNQGEH